MLTHRTALTVLSLLGGLAAVPLIVAFTNTGWGVPGLAAYQTYELLNRLMAFALLFMTAGWLGLFRIIPPGYGRWGALLAVIGSVTMAAGNAAEFWLFSDLSYDCCNARHIAWSTFLLGSLVAAVGATGAGVFIGRTPGWSRWIGLLLALALPLEMITFILLSPFAAPALLALALAWLLYTNASPAQEGRPMTTGHAQL